LPSTKDYFEGALRNIQCLETNIANGMATNVESQLISKLSCNVLENHIPQIKAIIETVLAELNIKIKSLVDNYIDKLK
jgi:hypothetical protein